jgi:hypothetical protein
MWIMFVFSESILKLYFCFTVQESTNTTKNWNVTRITKTAATPSAQPGLSQLSSEDDKSPVDRLHRQRRVELRRQLITEDRPDFRTGNPFWAKDLTIHPLLARTSVTSRRRKPSVLRERWFLTAASITLPTSETRSTETKKTETGSDTWAAAKSSEEIRASTICADRAATNDLQIWESSSHRQAPAMRKSWLTAARNERSPTARPNCWTLPPLTAASARTTARPAALPAVEVILQTIWSDTRGRWSASITIITTEKCCPSKSTERWEAAAKSEGLHQIRLEAATITTTLSWSLPEKSRFTDATRARTTCRLPATTSTTLYRRLLIASPELTTFRTEADPEHPSVMSDRNIWVRNRPQSDFLLTFEALSPCRCPCQDLLHRSNPPLRRPVWPALCSLRVHPAHPLFPARKTAIQDWSPRPHLPLIKWSVSSRPRHLW